MIQLRRILIPTDFSEFSQHAMKYACEFSKRFSAELHVLNVVENIYPIVAEPGMAMPSAGEFLVDLLNSSERAIQSLPDSGWINGGAVVREVRTGTPFLEIIRYAKEKEIDLIVIGTHGRSGLVQVLMGSVAEKVVRKSPCPVLTVRPQGHDFVMP